MSDPRALALAPAVAAAAGGDRDAFDTLVRETSGVVCAITLAVTRDVQSSEDIAQDVYLDAWKGIARLRNPTSFLPWLRQLARNKAKQSIRTGARRRRHLTTDYPDAVLEAAADPAPDALDGLVASEDMARLRTALDDLPASAREVLVLYYREDRSVRQTAELLGIGEDAVKQRLARARSRVRDLLLQDASGILARTAPGAAFVAAVATALSVATPGVAAAASIGLSQTATGGKLLAGIGVTGVTAGAAAGFLGGLFGGLGGVFAGAHKLHREARDDRERRGAKVYAAAATTLMLIFLATLVLAPQPMPVTVSFLAMFGGFMLLSFGYIPHITARRRAAELLEDPGAAARHRRDRRHAILGCILGFTLGSIPIVWLWLR